MTTDRRRNQSSKMGCLFILCLVLSGLTSVFGQYALDRNLSPNSKVNPVRDPLSGAARRYVSDDNFGGGAFENPNRFSNFGNGTYNGDRTLGRSQKYDVEGSTGWKIYDQKLKQMNSDPETSNEKSAPQNVSPSAPAPVRSEIKRDLRQTGQRLELSATYQADLRIQSVSKSEEAAKFGDCSFYDDFLELIDVDRGTAVESKIRKLSLEESGQFIHLYGERLKSQNKWTESLGDKLTAFKNQIGGQFCKIETESSND